MNRVQKALLYPSPPSLKKRILYALETSLYWSGIAWSYSRFTQGSGAIILMYHSIAGPDEAIWLNTTEYVSLNAFTRQMRFLARHRKVISLYKLLEMIKNHQEIPNGTVVITFDDGYRNNFTQAVPILEKYHLPATFFLPTGLIDRGENMWADELLSFFSYRTCNHLYYNSKEVDLSCPHTLIEIYHSIQRQCVNSDLQTRNMILENLRTQLKPNCKPPKLLATWDDVNLALHHHNQIDIGAHSHDHLSLPNLKPEVAKEQVRKSFQRISEELSLKTRLFAYPYNRFCPNADLQLKALDVAGALANGDHKLITSASNLRQLPRVDTQMSQTELKYRTTGAHPNLIQVLKKPFL